MQPPDQENPSSVPPALQGAVTVPHRISFPVLNFRYRPAPRSSTVGSTSPSIRSGGSAGLAEQQFPSTFTMPHGAPIETPKVVGEEPVGEVGEHKDTTSSRKLPAFKPLRANSIEAPPRPPANAPSPVRGDSGTEHGDSTFLRSPRATSAVTESDTSLRPRKRLRVNRGATVTSHAIDVTSIGKQFQCIRLPSSSPIVRLRKVPGGYKAMESLDIGIVDRVKDTGTHSYRITYASGDVEWTRTLPTIGAATSNEPTAPGFSGTTKAWVVEQGVGSDEAMCVLQLSLRGHRFRAKRLRDGSIKWRGVAFKKSETFADAVCTRLHDMSIPKHHDAMVDPDVTSDDFNPEIFAADLVRLSLPTALKQRRRRPKRDEGSDEVKGMQTFSGLEPYKGTIKRPRMGAAPRGSSILHPAGRPLPHRATKPRSADASRNCLAATKFLLSQRLHGNLGHVPDASFMPWSLRCGNSALHSTQFSTGVEDSARATAICRTQKDKPSRAAVPSLTEYYNPLIHLPPFAMARPTKKEATEIRRRRFVYRVDETAVAAVVYFNGRICFLGYYPSEETAIRAHMEGTHMCQSIRNAKLPPHRSVFREFTNQFAVHSQSETFKRRVGCCPLPRRATTDSLNGRAVAIDGKTSKNAKGCSEVAQGSETRHATAASCSTLKQDVAAAVEMSNVEKLEFLKHIQTLCDIDSGGSTPVVTPPTPQSYAKNRSDAEIIRWLDDDNWDEENTGLDAWSDPGSDDDWLQDDSNMPPLFPCDEARHNTLSDLLRHLRDLDERNSTAGRRGCQGLFKPFPRIRYSTFLRRFFRVVRFSGSGGSISSPSPKAIGTWDDLPQIPRYIEMEGLIDFLLISDAEGIAHPQGVKGTPALCTADLLSKLARDNIPTRTISVKSAGGFIEKHVIGPFTLQLVVAKAIKHVISSATDFKAWTRRLAFITQFSRELLPVIVRAMGGHITGEVSASIAAAMVAAKSGQLDEMGDMLDFGDPSITQVIDGNVRLQVGLQLRRGKITDRCARISIVKGAPQGPIESAVEGARKRTAPLSKCKACNGQHRAHTCEKGGRRRADRARRRASSEHNTKINLAKREKRFMKMHKLDTRIATSSTTPAMHPESIVETQIWEVRQKMITRRREKMKRTRHHILLEKEILRLQIIGQLIMDDEKVANAMRITGLRLRAGGWTDLAHHVLLRAVKLYVPLQVDMPDPRCFQPSITKAGDHEKAHRNLESPLMFQSATDSGVMTLKLIQTYRRDHFDVADALFRYAYCLEKENLRSLAADMIEFTIKMYIRLGLASESIPQIFGARAGQT